MPTYEYLCQSCRHRFETWQKMIEEPLTVCPECGGSIRRVLFPAGVVFKGSGFYKTDHPGVVVGENGASKEETKTASSDGKEAATPSTAAKSEGASKSESSTGSTTSSSKEPAASTAKAS